MTLGIAGTRERRGVRQGDEAWLTERIGTLTKIVLDCLLETPEAFNLAGHSIGTLSMSGTSRLVLFAPGQVDYHGEFWDLTGRIPCGFCGASYTFLRSSSFASRTMTYDVTMFWNYTDLSVLGALGPTPSPSSYPPLARYRHAHCYLVDHPSFPSNLGYSA